MRSSRASNDRSGGTVRNGDRALSGKQIRRGGAAAIEEQDCPMEKQEDRRAGQPGRKPEHQRRSHVCGLIWPLGRCSPPLGRIHHKQSCLRSAIFRQTGGSLSKSDD
jgi:hypothetical protein